MARFTGRVAIVTGAGSGIGRATAARLASEEATVACLDVAAGACEETAAKIRADGGAASAYACNVADADSVQAAVDAAVRELGPPHVVCNVAGIGRFAHSHEATIEEWNRIIGVNLTGTFLVCRATLPHLLATRGNIVNTASTAGLMAQPYSAAYCASKGGVVQLTRALAYEYVERGVRVNAVAPGGIDTPIINDFGFPEGASKKLVHKMMSPMGMGRPEDVAAVFAFIASDEVPHMTGAIVTYDGGLTS